ncbi:MAG: MTH1187 family thiamine-binding protein [Candidatus Thiodiazotropha sp. (ex Lucinoma kastoroae)]|nr:MTH1187 family thiamine-binding protein [Candidatus Thiodiazotropha sp. (ex Lucinoma kastoroae)]
MSVLLEFSIFPLDQEESVSQEVSQVVAMIKKSGIDYPLTAMGTLIETSTTADALSIVQKATELLHKEGSQRVYATIKIDSRVDKEYRLQGKIQSVQARIGKVNLSPNRQDIET